MENYIIDTEGHKRRISASPGLETRKKITDIDVVGIIRSAIYHEPTVNDSPAPSDFFDLLVRRKYLFDPDDSFYQCVDEVYRCRFTIWLSDSGKSLEEVIQDALAFKRSFGLD